MPIQERPKGVAVVLDCLRLIIANPKFANNLTEELVRIRFAHNIRCRDAQVIIEWSPRRIATPGRDIRGDRLDTHRCKNVV